MDRHENELNRSSGRRSDGTVRPQSLPTRLSAVGRLLSGRACVALSVALGVFFTLPTTMLGFMGDDYLQYAFVWSPFRAPWDLFRFMDGSVRMQLLQIRYGIAPWITDPETRIAFFRPLPSITHWIDYRFWPHLPMAMHFENVVWYGLLIALVALVYRRIHGVGGVAGLSALSFAVDDIHGPTVGWIANRNALMAGCAVALVLLAHHRTRTTSPRSSLLGPAVFMLSLTCGEASLEVVGYIVAYALFLDAGDPLSRMRSILPYVAVAVAWILGAHLLGYGVARTAYYLDFLGDPRAFLEVPKRLAILTLLQVGLPGAEKLLPESSAPAWGAPAVYLAACVVFLAVAASRDRRSSFWMLGATLATLPACGSLPNARLLAIPSIGFTIGIVSALVALLRPLPHGRRWLAWWVASVPVGLALALSIVVSPIGLVAVAAMPFPGAPRVGPVAHPLVAAPSQDAILVNNLDWLGPTLLKITGPPAATPRSILQLASAADRLDVERIDDRTLVLRAPLGLRGITGFVRRPSPVPVGTTVTSLRFRLVVIDALPNGEPTGIRCTFDAPLEDPSLVWFTSVPDGFLPLVPPAVGHHWLIHGFMPAAPDP